MRLATFCQILLVIFLGWPELRRRFNLCHDRTRKSATLIQLRLGRLGRFLLFGGMIKNHGSVLRADIGTLPIHRGWIVAGPENIKQFLITDLGGIELDLHGFGVTSFICANIFVGWVLFRSARVADGG